MHRPILLRHLTIVLVLIFGMLQREVNNTDEPRIDKPFSTPKVEIMDMLEQPNDRIENEDYPPIDEP